MKYVSVVWLGPIVCGTLVSFLGLVGCGSRSKPESDLTENAGGAPACWVSDAGTSVGGSSGIPDAGTPVAGSSGIPDAGTSRTLDAGHPDAGSPCSDGLLLCDGECRSPLPMLQIPRRRLSIAPISMTTAIWISS
jgi:hypothetical protein